MVLLDGVSMVVARLLLGGYYGEARCCFVTVWCC